MQKSQLKADKKSRGFEKQQTHRHLDAFSRIVLLHRLVTCYGVLRRVE